MIVTKGVPFKHPTLLKGKKRKQGSDKMTNLLIVDFFNLVNRNFRIQARVIGNTYSTYLHISRITLIKLNYSK